MPTTGAWRPLSCIQLKLVKIGARIVSHCRMTIFQIAEAAVPEKLFLLDAVSNPQVGPSLPERSRFELVNAADAIRWSKTRDDCPLTTKNHAA
jgi:hypothetical protein